MEKNTILDKIRDSIEDAVKPIIKKGEAMSPVDLECLNRAVSIIDKINNIEDDTSYGDGYSSHGYGYSESNSYRRERSPITGRYVSHDVSHNHDGGSFNYHNGGNSYLATTSRRYYDGGSAHNGYSGHSRNDMTIYHIENLIDVAQTEQERQFLNDWLRRVRNNQ